MAETKTTTKTAAPKKTASKASATKTSTSSTKTTAAKTTTAKATTAKKTTSTKAVAAKAEAPKAVEVKAEVAPVEVKAVAPAKKEIAGPKLQIKLVKSKSGRLGKQIKTLTALGLNKINQTVIKPDNAATRGMLFVVKHLVEVTEIK